MSKVVLLNEEIPGHARVVIGLQRVKGIGDGIAKRICRAFEFGETMRMAELASSDLSAIRQFVEKNKIATGTDVTRQETINIKALISIKCRKGFRHLNHLPVNGQHTQTNARTAKGRRGVPIAGAKRKGK